MFKPLRQGALLLVLTLMFGLAAPTQARDLPDYYPDSFQWVGTLNKLDLRKNSIIVRDALFPLAQEVKVYTPRSRFATLQALRPGMKVGCRTEKDSQGRKVVSAIWIFPKSTRQLLLPPPPVR